MAWGLAAVLAVVVVGGVGLLAVRFKPYWVARYRGEGADLHGTNLRGANLHGANLRRARLSDVDLQGADLTSADLLGAALYDADLRNADLRGAIWWGCGAGITDVERIGAQFFGARYNRATRWPAGCNPRKECARQVE